MGAALAAAARDAPILVSLGFVPCWAALHAMAIAVSSTSTTYVQLRPGLRAEWCNKVVSTAHAVMMAGAAAHYLATHARPWGMDPQSGRDNALDWMWAASLGYTTYDLIHWAQHRQQYGNVILGHHVVMFAAVWSELTTNYATFIACLLAVSECSTPFVNMRWYLRSMRADGAPTIINNVLLVLAFLFGRVATTAYALLLHLSTAWIYHASMTWAELLMYSGIVVTFVCLNCWWASLICRGAWRLITGQAKKKRVPGEAAGGGADAGRRAKDVELGGGGAGGTGDGDVAMVRRGSVGSLVEEEAARLVGADIDGDDAWEDDVVAE